MDSSEPALPPHPEVNLEARRPPGLSLLKKKRTYDASMYEADSLTTTSSDPALFSGDEQEAVGAEDYTGKRKKKMFAGSWWSHQVKAGKEEKRKEFKRNFDSGIFMGSDSDIPSSDSFSSLEEELVRDQARVDQARGSVGQSMNRLAGHLETPRLANPLLARRPPNQAEPELNTIIRKRPVTRRHDEQHTEHGDLASYDHPTSSQHSEVLQIIHQCLDEGQENVDMSGLNLSELPADIGQLYLLTKQPNFVAGMLESGASLETHLRIFLGNNLLQQLPLPLLNLTNLRELSLRRNKLTSLPSGIRNLINLEKLNVSGNQLQQLPFEVIELAANHRLRELITEPNAWEALNEDQVTQDQYTIQQIPLNPREVSGRRACLTRAVPISQSTSVATRSSPVSLTEMLLRRLARYQCSFNLQDECFDQVSPRALKSLELLNKTVEEGGLQCNRCGRVVVRPGAEWIELWRVNHTFIPIRRVQCASGCEGTATRWCEAMSSQDD